MSFRNTVYTFTVFIAMALAMRANASEIFRESYTAQPVDGPEYTGPRQVSTQSLDLRLIADSYAASGIDLSRVEAHSADDIYSWYALQMIPMNMNPSNDGGVVAGRILGQSLQSLFNSEEFKSSFFGRSVQTVAKKLETNVSLGSSGKFAPTEHRLAFRFKADKGIATMAYSGFTNAILSFRASPQEWDFEIFHDLSSTARFAFDMISRTDDQRELVSYKLSW